jgi:hypothetical protein
MALEVLGVTTLFGVHIIPWLLVLVITMMTSACATKPEPFVFQPENDGIQGPGILTGEDGLWTIIGSSPTDKNEGTASEDGNVVDRAKHERTVTE